MKKAYSEKIIRVPIVLMLTTMLSAQLVAILTIPSSAWEYNNGTAPDNLSESFGPRADRILIQLYSNEQSMWNALESEQLDLTDWQLTNEAYESFSTPPLNNTVNVVSSGSDGTFYILDINNNNNAFLGNPPDPAYPNPVYPNPRSVLGMRKAIAYLCNRDYIINNITGPFGCPLYTPMLPESGQYVHPEIRPGGAREDLCYLYSRAMANVSLDSSGFAQKDTEGWRIWNVTGQRVELRFYIKYAHEERKAFGDYLASELEAVGIKVQKIYWPIVSPNEDPAIHKNFHLSIDGWSGLDVEPDHLILWHWDYYWHPGRCYNIGGCNDAIYNQAVNNALYADTLEQTIAPVHVAQERFAEMVLSVPLWCGCKLQAVSRRYVGTPNPDAKDPWEGQYWEGLVLKGGMSASENGVINPITLMNMHPENYVKGDCSHMTIKCGFPVPELYSLNPIFGEWSHDNKVLDMMYESLLKRDPYNLSNFVPWLAQSFEVGTYTHPTLGNCTKIRIAMRSNVYWSDGTPLTAADVCFSLSEMYKILYNRGINPIWCPWMDYIAGFKITDPHNFDILLDTKDVWAISWIGTSRILPKHIWEPICKTAAPSYVTGFAPDPNLVASGPWRLKEYVENSHVELVKNSPSSVVQTNLAGSTPITSPHGCFKITPLEVNVYSDDYRAKIHIMVYPFPTTVHFTADLRNLWYGGNLTVDKYLYIDDVMQPGYPLTSLTLTPYTLHTQHFNYSWISGKHSIKVAAYIREPEWWAGKWVNATFYIWITIKADIVGSTFYDDIGYPAHPLKAQLPTPDLQVDLKDVLRAALAFASIPGHSKWDSLCDINEDNKVDLKDYFAIAANYGWTG
ncbi:MAG: ABC transporter substrate-binding protein [Candidatus Bathyarchaeota archaeon]|nr:ABC transporter substrate-binding protein [Candidatus Bathyarchaeota archaeon]